MKDVILKIKILAGAQKALLEAQAGRTTEKVVLLIGAALFGLVALFMLNLAGVAALEPYWGKTVAALIIAGVDVATAAMFLLGSRGRNAERAHEKALKEIRDLTLRELENDLEGTRVEFQRIIDELQQAYAGLAGFGTLSSTLVFLFRTLMDFFSGNKKEDSGDGTSTVQQEAD